MFDENRSGRAILVMDMISDYVSPIGKRYIPNGELMLPLLQGELQYFRERMRTVIFANTRLPKGSDFAEEGSSGASVIPSLQPRAKEHVVTKARPNAFFETALARVLCECGIRKITIVGLPTDSSVLLTVASALDLGFEVVVPETCVSALNEEEHRFALKKIHEWIGA